jgi:hypothetical protein
MAFEICHRLIPSISPEGHPRHGMAETVKEIDRFLIKRGSFND